MRSPSFLQRFRKWVGISIHRRLAAWSIGFWFVSITILSLTVIWVGQARMIEETSRRNTQLASVISRDINAQISDICANARTFARRLEAIAPELTSQAEAVISLQTAFPQRYRAAYYFAQQGTVLFSLTGAPDILLSASPESVVSRPTGQVPEGVTATRQRVEGGIFVSDVVFSGIERALVMYIGLPVNLPSGDQRTIVLEINLSDIWQSANMVSVGQSGFAYIVSNNGIIIAHPDESYINRQLSPMLDPVLSGYEGYKEYLEPYRNKWVLAAYSPVGGQLGWGVIIQQDLSEAYATVSQTGFIIIGIWLVLAVAGTVSILHLMRNFTRPIVQLTSAARKIADTGELTQLPEVNSPDEVGQMGQAFGQMIGRIRQAETNREKAQQELQAAHDELETRVEQRTADLSLANTVLQNEIVQRREAEERLSQSEARYRDLVESASSIVLEMDTRGNVIYLNPFAVKFFGFRKEELLGRNVIGTIVPEKDADGRDLRVLIADIVQNPEKYSNSENENICRDGRRVWVAWTNTRVYDRENKLSHILCTGIDQTEQKRATELLAEQTRNEAATAERTRLAHDLHDAVSQTLFSASLIAEVLPRLWEKNKGEGIRRLEEVRQLTRGALAEMRTLLFELRPAALANAELTELLRHLTESITGRARLPVNLEIEGSCSLAPEVKIALYRIAQEALNNVAKHSGAKQARVSLYCKPGYVKLVVSDNGHGFDVAHVRSGSLGLGIMRERAKQIRASLVINSGVGQGTEVTAAWRESPEEV